MCIKLHWAALKKTCGICLCRKNLLTPLLTLCLRDRNGSLRRKFLEERAYVTLTPRSFSTRPQLQLTRHLFYRQSGHKEAVRQLHYTAEDVEDEDKVDEISCKCWNSNLHTTWSSCVTLIAAALICWLRKTSDTESRSWPKEPNNWAQSTFPANIFGRKAWHLAKTGI